MAASTRKEYKYLVPLARLDTLRRDLAPFVDLDPFSHGSDKNEYTVRSIYLDTVNRECYYEKLSGVPIRKKFRIRGYNGFDTESLVFLEIKRKNHDVCSKNRAPLREKDLLPLFNSRDLERYILPLSGNGVEKQDANRFMYYYYKKNLRPTVLIVYEREAFMGKFDASLRLTLDKNIRSVWCASLDTLHAGPYIAAFTDFIVFEVKFHRGVPGWLQTILARHDLRRTSVSKYAICLDSLKGRPQGGRQQASAGALHPSHRSVVHF